VLNIIVPVFDLGRSYENVRSGKRPEIWKSLEIYIQNCVGTLKTQATAGLHKSGTWKGQIDQQKLPWAAKYVSFFVVWKKFWNDN